MTPSVLRAQLLTFINGGKAEQMKDFLHNLRNADFRSSGQILAEKDIWKNADFWHFASVLVRDNSKAFLGTMLKAASALRNFQPSQEFADACTSDIDKKKALEMLIPNASTPQAVQQLMSMFGIDEMDENIKAGILFRSGTSAAFFELFKLLKRSEDDEQLLRRYGVELIRKGDKRSFNLACIIKEYFGLSSLPGTFSLSLPPYELSRLDSSYESFVAILNKY